MFNIFKKFNLIVELSERKDGEMSSPGFLVGKFDNQKIVKNRNRFFKKIGISAELVVTMGCFHSNNVKVVKNNNAGKILSDTDGLLSKEKNLFLSLTVADCLPIYIYDPKNEAVGLLHCGWRGIAKNILDEAINKMVKEFNSSVRDILIGVGPGISKCHFKVGREVAVKLGRPSNEEFIDLKRIVKTKLLRLGLKEKHIEISPDCTFCLANKYFSYRRERPESPQTMVAVIGMRAS